jgi:hypothetical protein
MKSTILKIPLLSWLIGSFSWLVFPEISLLVADRWIIICGIFLSIFAGYGILHVLRNLNHRFMVVVGGSALASVAIVGLAYALMAYDTPFFLYGLARDDIEESVPVSMQFNSVDIRDSGKL